MKKLFTILLMLFALSSFSQNIWLTERLDVKISDKSKIKIEYEDRLEDFELDYEPHPLLIL